MAHEDWLNHEDGWRVDGDASTEMFVDVCWFSVTHPTHDDIPSKKLTCLKTNIAKDWEPLAVYCFYKIDRLKKKKNNNTI